MDPYQETFATWNKVAKLYEEKFMDLDIYNDSYDAFCEAISKADATILEVGCGPGNISKYLLAKRPDFRMTGIDVSPNMIELAKINNPAARFEVMDCRQMHQLEGGFDGIISGFCLPYLSAIDLSNFLNNCVSLLAATGHLYLSFVEGDYSQSGYKAASTGDQTYFYYHSLQDVQQELAQHQFKPIYLDNKEYKKSDGTVETHCIIIAGK